MKAAILLIAFLVVYGAFCIAQEDFLKRRFKLSVPDEETQELKVETENSNAMLGKYFVYINCATCKIKSELVVKEKSQESEGTVEAETEEDTQGVDIEEDSEEGETEEDTEEGETEENTEEVTAESTEKGMIGKRTTPKLKGKMTSEKAMREKKTAKTTGGETTRAAMRKGNTAGTREGKTAKIMGKRTTAEVKIKSKRLQTTKTKKSLLHTREKSGEVSDGQKESEEEGTFPEKYKAKSQDEYDVKSKKYEVKDDEEETEEKGENENEGKAIRGDKEEGAEEKVGEETVEVDGGGEYAGKENREGEQAQEEIKQKEGKQLKKDVKGKGPKNVEAEDDDGIENGEIEYDMEEDVNYENGKDDEYTMNVGYDEGEEYENIDKNGDYYYYTNESDDYDPAFSSETKDPPEKKSNFGKEMVSPTKKNEIKSNGVINESGNKEIEKKSQNNFKVVTMCDGSVCIRRKIDIEYEWTPEGTWIDEEKFTECIDIEVARENYVLKKING